MPGAVGPPPTQASASAHTPVSVLRAGLEAAASRVTAQAGSAASSGAGTVESRHAEEVGSPNKCTRASGHYVRQPASPKTSEGTGTGSTGLQWSGSVITSRDSAEFTTSSSEERVTFFPGQSTTGLLATTSQSTRRRNSKKVGAGGIMVDAQTLIVGLSHAVDVFKGFILVLLATSQALIALSSAKTREQSGFALVLCNSAYAQCFAGLVMAFGYSCYGKNLRGWPDPVNVTWDQVLRTACFPMVCAWICSFADCMLRPAVAEVGGDAGAPTADADARAAAVSVGRIIALEGAHGSGPDALLACGIFFLVVYALWSPFNQLIGCVERGWARDALVLVLALLPLASACVAVGDCTGPRQWIGLLLPCAQADRTLVHGLTPALPHLANFNLGIILAITWDRFIADLRPITSDSGHLSSSLYLLPWPAAYRWMAAVSCITFVLVGLFVPLGQVWLYVDLLRDQVDTPIGQLAHGPHAIRGGPSALSLLSGLWPLGVLVALSCLSVAFQGNAQLRRLLELPTGELEHLGANVLYYVVVVNVFLAGLSRGQVKGPDASVARSLLTAVGILVAGRFLHVMAKAARK